MTTPHSLIRRFARAAWPFCFLAFLAGCTLVATRRKLYESVIDDLRAHNYEEAVSKVETERFKKNFAAKDRFLYYLDSGMVNHYAGRYDVSNERLTLAEDAAEELFTKSISRAAASLLLNDNTLEYSGEDYEILYANLIKALNYLSLGMFDDAFVEIRRANEKLELLEQKYARAAELLRKGSPKDTSKADVEYPVAKVRFNNDALARYLSMHMYAAEGKMDDARIDYQLLKKAFQTQPHIYDFPVPDIRFHSQGKAVLSIVALTGLAPVKEALNLRIRTDKDLNLVQVLYTGSGKKDVLYGQMSMPVSADYYFKFAIPKIVPQPSQISRIRVKVDSRYLGDLQLLEDVAKIAEETFKAKKLLVYVRSVARAVAKGLAAHELKKKADTGGLEGWLKKAAIDVGTDITEAADLRCSRFLPGAVYVGDFELDEGEYDLTVEFLDSSGNTISTEHIPAVRVARGDFNLARASSLN